MAAIEPWGDEGIAASLRHRVHWPRVTSLKVAVAAATAAATLSGCTSIFTSEPGAETRTVAETSTTSTTINEIDSDAVIINEEADRTATAEEDEILTMFNALEVGEMVVRVGDEIVAIDNHGNPPQLHRWTSDFSISRVAHDNQPDHTTLIGYTSDGAGRTTAIAAFTIDGTEVCRTDSGWSTQATRRNDGTWVMAVSHSVDPSALISGDGHGPVDADGQPMADVDPSGPFWNPAQAVDCSTGEATNILPRHGTPGEAASITRFFIGDRRFIAEGDAEGNGPVFTADGVELAAVEDYPGYVVFNTDGSQLIYTDHRRSPSPHVSRMVVSTDTTTGTELWRTELPAPTDGVFFDDDRAYFEISEQAGSGDLNSATEIAVLDSVTGELLRTVVKPAGVEILHLERFGNPDGG